MPKFEPDLAKFPLNQQTGPFASLVDGEFVASAERYLSDAAWREEDLGIIGDHLVAICEDYRDGVLPQQIINRFWNSIDRRVQSTEMMIEKIALEDKLYSMIINGQFAIIDLVIKRLEYDADNDETGKAQNYLDYFLDIYFRMQKEIEEESIAYETALEYRRRKNFNETIAAAVLAGALIIGTVTFHKPIERTIAAFQESGARGALNELFGQPKFVTSTP